MEVKLCENELERQERLYTDVLALGDFGADVAKILAMKRDAIGWQLAAARAEAEGPRPEEMPKELWLGWNSERREFHEANANRDFFFATSNAEAMRTRIWTPIKIYPAPPDETTTRLIEAACAMFNEDAPGGLLHLREAVKDYRLAHPTEGETS